MYLGPPQDFGEPPDISPDAVAAPSEAVGDLVQHTESCSSACNAVQPSEHTNGSDDEDERMVEVRTPLYASLELIVERPRPLRCIYLHARGFRSQR